MSSVLDLLHRRRSPDQAPAELPLPARDGDGAAGEIEITEDVAVITRVLPGALGLAPAPQQFDLPEEPVHPSVVTGWLQSTLPRAGVHVGGGDLVALSHALAAAGRLQEAAIAQWAADLHLVRPFLGSRAAELCAALESLSPTDAQAALTGARAALASLIDEGVPVLSLLGPTSHLSRSDTPVGEHVVEEALPVLPDCVEHALVATLERSARRGGDHHQVSVSLRRSLLRQRGARSEVTDPAQLVRSVLEQHEHPAFDDELARRTR